MNRLTSTAKKFMGSLHDCLIAHRDHEPGRAALPRRLGDRKWAARQRSPTRFMESLDLQHWTRIGALNRHDVAQPSPAASSGGVSPLGPSSSETLGELAGGTPALQGRFMESLMPVRFPPPYVGGYGRGSWKP